MVLQYSEINNISLPLQTAIGTVCSSFWRFNLMSIDTCKTMLKVYGSNGIPLLKDKLKSQVIRSIYHGSLGATMLCYYPWFFTFGYLDKTISVGDLYL